MKVFITSAYPYNQFTNFTPAHLKESFDADPFKIHEFVETPEQADIIIFAENHPGIDPFYFQVLKNKIYKKFKSKCYLYHDNDHSLTFLPTISPSILKHRSDPVFHQPFFYIIQLTPNNIIRQPFFNANKKYLFSFVGAKRNTPARKKIFDLKYEKSLLLDTSGKRSWEMPEAEREDYEALYARICFESKFILCPGGIGPNSYRLYESLEMGIAPVIISDEWVPSAGPKWQEFSVIIPEADVDKLPEMLERLENDAEKMGRAARAAWLNYFAKDKHFHYLTEAALQLHTTRDAVGLKTYFDQYKRFLEPFYLRAIGRYFKNTVKRIFKPTK